MQTIRKSFDEIQAVLKQILLDHHFDGERAQRIAHVHAASSLDGVYSHGLNRFPAFIESVQKGFVRPEAQPQCVLEHGAIEQWDGDLGSGVWNATLCMKRARELARERGLSVVALRNTNHWMRGGTYGWETADEGMIAICFTNTKPNMPPWGGRDSRTGNNPLVIAVPGPDGAHLVLDMSMSQFSFGKINEYRLAGEKLPHAGGWDEHGNLTDDPEPILKEERGLPIGFWKGSALSIMLDALATVLSSGRSTYRIGLDQTEWGVSQVFMCIDPSAYGDTAGRERLLREIVDNIHHVDLIHPEKKTRVPGENTLKIRRKNLEQGIPVDKTIWKKIESLRKN